MKKPYFELAPSQIPEWYAYQFDPQSPVYNISFNHYFFENMNAPRFMQAWQQIIDRHDIFRICFDYIDGRPVQTLMPSIVLNRSDVLVDKISVEEQDKLTIQNKLAHAYGTQPFDFSIGPLFRLHLIQYSGNESQLIFTVHHIIWDETSTMNLMHEFTEIYNALSDDRTPALATLNCQYFDYVERIHQQLASGELDHHKTYWLNHFKNTPSALPLPFDYPRPAIQTYNGETIERWLPRELVHQVMPFLAEHNVTLFMLLMAVFNLYFYRITQQDDIVLGCPIAGRDNEDLKPLLGCFATPLPIRCQLNPEQPFHALLQQLRATILDAFEHRQYPCTKLIEQLAHQKDYSRPKLFSVMAGMQNDKTSLLHMPLRNCRMYAKEVYRVEAHGARFDLAIGLDPLGSDVKFFCTYNSDLFAKKTVDIFLDGITCLFQEVINKPHEKLSQFRLMSYENEQKLFNDFNQTTKVFPQNQSIHGLFELQVHRTPDTIAIEYDHEKISYKTLNQQANQLAHYLRDRGVKHGDAVALIFEPSTDMVAGILAVLKSGAYYVPISPTTPAARCDEMITLLNVKYLITQRANLVMTNLAQLDIIVLDEYAKEIESCRKDQLVIEKLSLAYTMYTSGTTNQPKAIPIGHDGVINLLYATQSQYHLTAKDKILLSTVFTFDASILEIFWPLSFGGCIVIPKITHLTPSAIAQTVVEKAITILQTVPIFLEGLCDVFENQQKLKTEQLRLILCGSAVLTRHLRDRCKRILPTKLVNHYGPTEVTVDATSFDCDEDFLGETVPIGRPIANAKVFILDEYLNLCPIGIPGEIYVASPGLTPGYVHHSHENQKRFIVKSWPDNTQYRLYKTGDMGKLDERGVIYFCGRKDKQIKMNGQRIELEEIEQVLTSHPLVAKAIVQFTPHLRAGLEGQLTAFIEARNMHPFTGRSKSYHQYTLGQRPGLLNNMKLIHLETWPAYFNGSPAIAKYWSRVWTEFPDFQFCLLDDNEDIAAVCNGIPLYWDGTPDHVPSGWDEGIELAFQQAENAIKPNTLLGLTGVVTTSYRSQGISPLIVYAFRALAKMHGLDRFLGPVRPVGMLDHHCHDLTLWASQVDANNEPLDHWLRTHRRIGAQVVGLAPYSQRIEGSLKDWEAWTGHHFTQSGEYSLAETLQPVKVDVEQNKAWYDDPSIWVMHDKLQEQRTEHDTYLNIAELKACLSQTLPAYMLPHHYHILAKLDLLDSGKVNEMALRATQKTETLFINEPQNEVQRCLKNAFQITLKLSNIGVEDDFFRLGGQSLQMLQILEKIYSEYDVKLSIQDFYRHPTVYQLEKCITTAIKVEQIC